MKNELKVIENSGKFVVDSREVAEMVDKRHDHLVRDIDGYLNVLNQNPTLGTDTFFVENSYLSGTGKMYKCYLLTKKGCDMVANKMSGEKGILFTATYVSQFEAMEKQIKTQQQIKLPTTYLEALKALVTSEEEKALVTAENIELKETIQIQAPKAEAFDLLMCADKLYSFQEASDLLGFKGIGQNKLFKLLRERKALMDDNLPYRQYIENGYFEVIEYSFEKYGKTYFKEKTLITTKGLKWILKGLLKLGYEQVSNKNKKELVTV